MISGGLAGGSSTKNADGWQIVRMFKGALGWFLDALDVYTRGSIAYAAQLSVGDKIAVAAKQLLGTSYKDVNECSGLVRKAYLAGGRICLDPWSNCGNDYLGRKYKISEDNTNGVKYLYELANAYGLANNLGGVRKTNDPLVGDMVFFSNTTGPGHSYDHMGIVITGPNSEGTISFAHATESKGVHISFMNITKPSDPLPYNSKIGDPKSCDNTCRAGQLFSGYGTVRNQ